MCLAAESFGSRLCYAEKTQFTPRENEVLRPAKISDCVFVINQALSLRALQEILTHAKSQQEVRILITVKIMVIWSRFDGHVVSKSILVNS